jgi:hypothetical protein
MAFSEVSVPSSFKLPRLWFILRSTTLIGVKVPFQKLLLYIIRYRLVVPGPDFITQGVSRCREVGYPFHLANKIVFQRIEDQNVLPFAHVILTFLNNMTYVPDALSYIEERVSWKSIVTLVN